MRHGARKSRAGIEPRRASTERAEKIDAAKRIGRARRSARAPAMNDLHGKNAPAGTNA
jgi:hypothetical protein